MMFHFLSNLITENSFKIIDAPKIKFSLAFSAALLDC